MAKFLEGPSEVESGNAWEGEQHWLQMWGNWQERWLHLDSLLKLKQYEPGPLLWRRVMSALGQSAWLWQGLEHTKQCGLASPENVTIHSSRSTMSQGR